MGDFPPAPPPPLSTPPQDRNKPAIPYEEGKTFKVFRHTPPPPIGREYNNWRVSIPGDLLQQSTQWEYCLAAPPPKGTTHSDARFLTISKELAVRDGRGAQLVVVNDDLVAKIYDPLYYPSFNGYGSYRPDVVWLAEKDYSREAAAYEELDARFGGTIVPKYHGSWTLEVPVDAGPGITPSGVTKRPVRLILMELINGKSMRELDPHRLSEEQRSTLMIKAIDALLAIWDHGVIHGDFSPRNVICSNGDYLGRNASRVVLIDFNVSRIPRLFWFRQNSPGNGPEDSPEFSSALPISPIVRLQQYTLNDFVFHEWIQSPPEE